MKKISLLSCALLSVMACNAQSNNYSNKNNKAKYEYQDTNTKVEKGNVTMPPSLAWKFFNNSQIDAKVNAIYQKMNSKQKAAQMIMVASSEALGFPYSTSVKPNVNKEFAANVLFLKGTKAEFIKQNKELLNSTIEGLQPLFACDCEPTLLHNKFVGEKKMLATANLKNASQISSSIDTINKLMDEMGIIINFAPIVDIAINKSVINKRSFGNDPESIKSLSGEFVKITQQNYNKAATVKHFPGHGAVVGDTHKQSVSINGKMTELNTFEEVIKKTNPMFVMIGHISVKNNPDGFNTEDGRPATTSKKIITDLLRNKMAYKGIITTDAMNMQASKNFPDADWEAAKAGVDLVLMPLDAAKLNNKIAAEFEKGSELSKQFEASVKRIIKLKLLSQKNN